jgi:antigen KI-67
MTPAREPAPTVPPTISHPPVCTPKAEVHTPSRITKIDTPKVEKAETPKVEKAETPKATPKVEKTETPKTVTPKASTPKVATPKAATPKVTPKATPKETTPRSSGRQRKTVDRLSPEALDRTPTKEIEIPSGHGSKLGDIAHSLHYPMMLTN